MLTQAPLPKLKHLLLAVFKSAPSDDQLSACWQTPGGKSFWLSRSSWALKAIVLWWEKTFDRAPIIWFPDYFCNEALSLVRTTSATIKFYSVDKNLMPKWDVCHALAKTAKPDIFVLVHYFGQPSDLVGAKQFCEAYQSLIIEDAAHVLCPTADIGSVGHFTLYSPHKLLAVPHGSICVMSPKKLSDYIQVRATRQG